MRKEEGREEYICIRGRQQYLLHYPAAPEAPVLLFLHGGPGTPESNLGYLYHRWWRGLFTTVHWDQPGAGKTLARNPGAPQADFEEVYGALQAIIGHLKAQYGKEHIVLLGHSWGSVLGSVYALAYPLDVALYIGVGQMVDFAANEAFSFAMLGQTIEKAGRANDREKWQALAPFLPVGLERDALTKQLQQVRKLQVKYGVVMRLEASLIKAFCRSPAFRLADLSLMSGKSARASAGLVDYLMQFELSAMSHDYQVPVAYILGRQDYQTASELAAAYFETITAPKKSLHWVENAGHNTMFDQPQAFAEALAQAARLL